MANCAYHPEREAVAGCVNCGKMICTECKVELAGKTYCNPCANEVFIEKTPASIAPEEKQAATDSASTPSPEVNTKHERILGFIDVLTHGGFLHATLCFTTNRVILLKTSSSKGVAAAMATGLAGTAVWELKAHQRRMALRSLSVDEIISSDQSSFSIPYPDIQMMHIKKAGAMKAGRVQMVTTEGEKKFRILATGLVKIRKHDFGFLDELSTILGAKLTVKG